MNTAERIEQSLDIMTKSERQIAVYFPSHVHDFAFLTLDQLAQKTDVSTTSVIRFCRRIGFSGFKDFQEQLRKDIRYQPDLPVKFMRTRLGHEENVLLTHTLEQSIQCIQRTFQELSLSQLEETIQALTNARRIYTFGMKESFALAHYLYTRLVSVRKDVFILDAGYNSEVEPILSMMPGDVCIVFLFHRYTRQTMQILPLLKKQGVHMILITSPPFHEVQKYASCILPCYVDVQSIKNSSAAPVCLCDYLCSELSIRLGDQALQYMRSTEDLFTKGSVLGDTLMT